MPGMCEMLKITTVLCKASFQGIMERVTISIQRDQSTQGTQTNLTRDIESHKRARPRSLKMTGQSKNQQRMKEVGRVESSSVQQGTKENEAGECRWWRIGKKRGKKNRECVCERGGLPEEEKNQDGGVNFGKKRVSFLQEYRQFSGEVSGVPPGDEHAWTIVHTEAWRKLEALWDSGFSICRTQ